MFDSKWYTLRRLVLRLKLLFERDIQVFDFQTRCCGSLCRLQILRALSSFTFLSYVFASLTLSEKSGPHSLDYRFQFLNSPVVCLLASRITTSIDEIRRFKNLDSNAEVLVDRNRYSIYTGIINQQVHTLTLRYSWCVW